MLEKANQPQVIDRKVWLTVNEAAEFSQYSKDYIRRLARADTLVSLKLGPILLIERQSLLEYARGYTVSPKYRRNLFEPNSPTGLTFERWLDMNETQRSARRSTVREKLHESRNGSDALIIREGVSEAPYDILAALRANGRTRLDAAKIPANRK